MGRIHFYSEEKDKHLIFITTIFYLPDTTIEKQYKIRLKIELFFKWIKRNVPLKAFFGNNENAVKTQVWVAVCTYLIVAIIKKEQKILQPMSEILQVLGVLQFAKRPISERFTLFDSDNPEGIFSNHLLLLGL